MLGLDFFIHFNLFFFRLISVSLSSFIFLLLVCCVSVSFLSSFLPFFCLSFFVSSSSLSSPWHHHFILFFHLFFIIFYFRFVFCFLLCPLPRSHSLSAPFLSSASPPPSPPLLSSPLSSVFFFHLTFPPSVRPSLHCLGVREFAPIEGFATEQTRSF